MERPAQAISLALRRHHRKGWGAAQHVPNTGPEATFLFANVSMLAARVGGSKAFTLIRDQTDLD